MNKQLYSKLTKAELAEIFPPITRNNFVVRDNWFGRNQIITFVNNKGQQITYNHDEVLKVMLPKLKLMPCWIKRKYWSQSTDMPSNVRDKVIERLDLTKQSASFTVTVWLWCIAMRIALPYILKYKEKYDNRQLLL